MLSRLPGALPYATPNAPLVVVGSYSFQTFSICIVTTNHQIRVAASKLRRSAICIATNRTNHFSSAVRSGM